MSWKAAGVVAVALSLAVVFARIAEDPDAGTVTWDASRASGFAGYLLLWASAVTGIGVHLRVRPRNGALTRVIESHRILSTLALSFVVVHVVALLLDPVVHFSVLDGLVPFTSAYRPLQVGTGTIAQWLLVLVLTSTALSNAMTWGRWRRLHLLSFPCYVLALLHGITAGSDSGQALAMAVYASTASLVAAAVVVRILGRRWVDAAEIEAATR